MKRKLFTTTRIIMLGFLIGALIGALLLHMPICQREGVKLSFIDSLFVATSSICVTGLSTVNIGQTFAVPGQMVILLLIQMGGLGIVTFTTLLLLAIGKRITLENRLLIQSAYNLDTLSGLVKITMRIVKATICIELIGALFYAIVFVPEYGIKGIWFSIFHSISAFCNAGIDLLGGNSFCMYRDNAIVNINTMILIILGGLGFPVYWEIIRCLNKNRINKKKDSVKDYRKMNFHAKLVIRVTIVLLVVGALFTFLFEYNNPDTLGNLSLPKKIMASFFQSTTLRTAGFATIDQAYFRSATCIIYIIFMFIGGSPAGTAGGVKTVTVTLLVASVIANVKGRKDVTILKRKITDSIVRRCVAIISVSLSVLVVLMTLLLLTEPHDMLNVMYEMTSAIATVGLSRGLTSELTFLGKIIVTLAMYLGRIGPISLALAFNSKVAENNITRAEAKVMIG